MNLLGHRSVLAIGAALVAACVGPSGGGEPSSRTPAFSAVSTSTDGVLCGIGTSRFNRSASVNATSTSAWRCNDGTRVLTANGIPDHVVGTFPNPENPNAIRAQTVSATFTLSPIVTGTATALGGPRGAVGYVLNGVKIDPDTNGGCNDSGSRCDAGSPAGQWRMEALGGSSFKFGTDSSNAHVQPSGEYHYHGMPEGFVVQQGKGPAMSLIGWAADGFPIYARYGYSVASDARSAIHVMKGSYRLKTKTDTNRPPVSIYPMGVFKQDHDYIAGSGDLDECNGRFGVTPEFPNGIYHYYATDTYPYLQRCVKGTVSGGGRPPGPPPGT
jgi:hypothetical protein